MIGRNAAPPSTRWLIVLLIAFALSFAARGDDDQALDAMGDGDAPGAGG